MLNNVRKTKYLLDIMVRINNEVDLEYKYLFLVIIFVLRVTNSTIVIPLQLFLSFLWNLTVQLGSGF